MVNFLLFFVLSKWQAFKLATLSGFAEPLGVVIVGKSNCTKETLNLDVLSLKM